MAVTGNKEPLLTTIWEGVERDGKWEAERVPVSDAMWLLAPESMYHSPEGGGVSCIVLKALARPVGSQYPMPDIGVHDVDCLG